MFLLVDEFYGENSSKYTNHSNDSSGAVKWTLAFPSLSTMRSHLKTAPVNQSHRYTHGEYCMLHNELEKVGKHCCTENDREMKKLSKMQVYISTKRKENMINAHSDIAHTVLSERTLLKI